jgi:hypothetical protein
MTTGRVFRSAAAGLCALGLGLTIWAGPAAQAARRPVAARPAGHAESAAQAARAAQTAQTALAVTYKYTLSRIAFTGSRLAIAATDSRGDLYYFWQKASTTKWHKQLVASASRKQSYSKPSIAWTGSAVVIAVLDKAGDLITYAQHVNKTTWKRQQVAKASGSKFQSPSIAAGAGGAVLISAGVAGKLLSYELAPGGHTWTPLTASYGNFGPSSIIICYDNLISNYLALITATSGGTLYFWWERLDIPGWHQETVATPGPSGSYSGGSLAASNAASFNKIVITAATSNGAVDAWTQSIGGTGWSEQTVATTGSNHYSHPVIAWTGLSVAFPVSYFVITSASQKGKLAFWWAAASGSTWTPETVASAGKHAAYASPAISVTGKSTIITAINTKHGDVDFWYQLYTTTPWHKQLVASG